MPLCCFKKYPTYIYFCVKYMSIVPVPITGNNLHFVRAMGNVLWIVIRVPLVTRHQRWRVPVCLAQDRTCPFATKMLQPDYKKSLSKHQEMSNWNSSFRELSKLCLLFSNWVIFTLLFDILCIIKMLQCL